MAQNWDETKAAALKILGKDAEVPDLPDAVNRAQDNLGKTDAEFDKCREDGEAKIVTLQTANDGMKHGLSAFKNTIGKSDFKLDSKKKDDVPKIEKARKLLTGLLDQWIKNREHNVKVNEEVTKHLVQLGKYKQSATPL